MALFKQINGKKIQFSAEEEAEVLACWEINKKKYSDDCYKEQRMKSYPPIGEQLDAIYKMAIHLKSKKIDIGEEAEYWIEEITNIKESFPKPDVIKKITI